MAVSARASNASWHNWRRRVSAGRGGRSGDAPATIRRPESVAFS